MDECVDFRCGRIITTGEQHPRTMSNFRCITCSCQIGGRRRGRGRGFYLQAKFDSVNEDDDIIRRRPSGLTM